MAAALLTGCGGSAATPTLERIPPVAAAQALEELSSEVVLLDVRTPEEFAGGHLAGAVNIDFYAPDFGSRLDGLDKTVPYIIYCRSGNRSAEAIRLMETLEFDEVWEVAGGIVAWVEAGLPIEP